MSNIETIQRPVIAGPCAAESREQVLASADEAKKRGIEVMRMSIVKPRTEPGWKGIGIELGVPLMQEVAQMGVSPATEVMLEEEAEAVVNGVLKVANRVDIWLGSRNQNDKIQKEIGRIIAGDPRIRLGIKNQPWSDERHWKGIASHVVDGGADPSQLFMIHRGFVMPNHNGYRNPPDYDMALKIKHETGLPIYLDPSHIGGTVENVIEVSQTGMAMRQHGEIFDGQIVEVNLDAKNARTDAKQQLSWEQYDQSIAPTLVFADWRPMWLSEQYDPDDDWGD